MSTITEDGMTGRGHSAEAVAAFPDDATGPQHRLQLRAAFDQGMATRFAVTVDALTYDAIRAAFRDQLEVQAEAWDEATEFAREHALIFGDDADDLRESNPYRVGRTNPYRAGGVA